MPKKPTKLRLDVAETAYRTMLEATGQAGKTPPPAERSGDEKNPEAVARGSSGGRKGGHARAKKMGPEGRSDASRRAANARWVEKKDHSSESE
jgi:hypothetical protein